MKRNPQKFTPPSIVDHVCVECGGGAPAQFDNCDGFFLSILVGASEASKRLSIHPQLYRLVADGRIPSKRVGGCWRFDLPFLSVCFWLWQPP